MFKTNNEIIKIDAKATTPINTGVVFWSHDRGTAKFIFQLKKNGVNQTLSNGTLVPISLDFTIGEVKGKHIYHAVIEDAVNGIVSFILKDTILWFQGTVTGSIYLELPDTRSLDSAGRFTFDIQRSPIDLSTPPEQHFYWDGFNEILQEYDKTIEYIKLESKKLLDNLTTNVTNAQTKVDRLEKDIETANTTLNNRIDEIHQKIDDEEVYRKSDVFTKEESSANVIDQVIGKVSNENKVILDLKGKIVGSAVENPNDAKVTHTQTLLNPNSTDFFTLSQQAYDQQKDLDGVVLTVSNSLNGRFRQNVYSWDILTVTKKIVGDAFFEGLNADTVAKQVAILKKMVNVKTAVWGFGSNYSGNKLSLKIWGNDTSWIGEANHTEATISKLEYDSTLNTNSFISEDGFVYVTAFSEPSDGNTASSLSVDYANLELEFNLSVHEYINNMIAANHVENIASQEEAEAGTDNTKIMTPLRTREVIDKQAVSIAGNQTIGGIKNFQNEPLVDGSPVGLINDACWCEDFAVNSLAAGKVNPDLQRFTTSNENIFSASGNTITIHEAGIYLMALGVNYTGLTSWVSIGISRTNGTSLVNRNLIEASTSGSNSFTYVRSFAGNDELVIEINSGKAGITMQKINLAIVKLA